MRCSGRTVVAASAAALVATAVTGCTSSPSTPPSPSTVQSPPRAGSTIGDASPVVFAFPCTVPSGGTVEFTTYAAVWDAHATDCSAVRVTGEVPSQQQQRAVDVANGSATLRGLAVLCAVTDAAPWTTAVTTSRSEDLARALLTYCPGHPQRDRLQDAIDAYAG